MIIPCPICGQRFRLDPSQLGYGRRVRCGNCGHVWFQSPEADTSWPTLPSSGDDGEGAPQSATLDDVAAEIRLHGGMDEDAAPPAGEGLRRLRVPPSTAAASLPPARPVRRSPARLIRWGVLVVALGGLVTGLALERDRLVAAWPAAALLYDTLGYPVEAPGAGLETADYKTEFRDVDGIPMLFIDVTVVNKSDHKRDVPDLMAQALAPDGKPFQSWRMQPKVRRLLPGETTTFQARVVEKGGQAKQVHLDYVLPEVPRPVSAHPEPVGDKEAAPVQAPSPEGQPAAAPPSSPASGGAPGAVAPAPETPTAKPSAPAVGGSAPAVAPTPAPAASSPAAPAPQGHTPEGHAPKA